MTELTADEYIQKDHFSEGVEAFFRFVLQCRGLEPKEQFDCFPKFADALAGIAKITEYLGTSNARSIVGVNQLFQARATELLGGMEEAVTKPEFPDFGYGKVAEALEPEMLIVRDEVKALTMMKRKRPWYFNVLILILVIGLAMAVRVWSD